MGPGFFGQLIAWFQSAISQMIKGRGVLNSHGQAYIRSGVTRGEFHWDPAILIINRPQLPSRNRIPTSWEVRLRPMNATSQPVAAK